VRTCLSRRHGTVLSSNPGTLLHRDCSPFRAVRANFKHANSLIISDRSNKQTTTTMALIQVLRPCHHTINMEARSKPPFSTILSARANDGRPSGTSVCNERNLALNCNVTKLMPTTHRFETSRFRIFASYSLPTTQSGSKAVRSSFVDQTGKTKFGRSCLLFL
jgi:hypothetical protein